MSLSSPLIGQSLLMLIFPLAAYLLFTAWCSPLVSQDVISHQKLVRLLCATHWQTGRKTSHQACSHQVSPYGADVVTDRCADLAAPCCLWLVRCCLHRNGVLGMSGGLGSMCAVSCGSWQPWGWGGGGHCNDVQRLCSAWLWLQRVTNEPGGGRAESMSTWVLPSYSFILCSWVFIKWEWMNDKPNDHRV